MAAQSDLPYCGREVRRYDRDRYLTCLVAPADRRPALFALYAFNLEVAKTAEVVSESMLGRIRLQWWRDALQEIYDGRPRRHEVVVALAEAVRRHGLSRAHFERLIDAREFDLEGEAPESLERLEAYAADTSGSLVLLAAEVLGGAGDEARNSAGRDVGIAWALTGLLRAVPFHARQKRLYLPRTLTEQAGLRVGDLFELRSSAALRHVARLIAARANDRLFQARNFRYKVAKPARLALAPAILADHYLAVLEKMDFDPFAPAVQAVPAGNVWRVAAARLLGRY